MQPSTLGNERAAHRRDRHDLSVENVSDIPGSVGTGTKLRKVSIEIAAVGQSDFGIGIDAEFNIPILDLESLGETRQRPHSSQEVIPERLSPA